MNMKLGTELSEADQKHALAAYVHRSTREHRPFWYRGFDKVCFKDDAEWLANTRFPVTKAGRIDRRAYRCESNPTWPDGKPGEA